MRETVKYRKKLFIENKDALYSTFKMTNRNVLLYTAYSAASQGKRVEPDSVKECKGLIEKKIAWHSTLRGTSLIPLSYMISCRVDRERTIDELSDAITLLKNNKFRDSDERALCAKILVENKNLFDRGAVAEKSRRIYLEMRDKHPFLTSHDDYPYAVLMSMSDKDEGVLISGSEKAYAILKDALGAYNSTQAISHIFSLCEDPEEESRRFLALYEAARAHKFKFYASSIELAALGALSVGDHRDPEIIASELAELSDELKKEKGFSGIFAYVTREQRNMYACMLLSERDENVQNAINFGAVIAQIAAETAAMVSAIVAVNAANAASSS